MLGGPTGWHARALETIAISAELKARALPTVDAWIKTRK